MNDYEKKYSLFSLRQPCSLPLDLPPQRIYRAIGVASTITVSYANGINPWTGKAIVTAKDLGLESDVSRIKEGIKYPSRNDGTTFQNREGLLPDHSLFEKIFNTKYYNV